MTLGEVLSHHVELLDLADTGHDVLALGVTKEVAVGTVLTGGGVARERDAGARVVALVAEHHGLDVHGGAEVVGDALEAPVVASTLAVPALEHGFDRVAQLLLGILGEVDARFLLDDPLERLDQLGEVRRRQFGIGCDSSGVTQLLELLLEQLAVDVEHDLAEHLHEPPVRVVGEPLVPGLLGQAADRAVVQAEVEDGVHHSRHRERRAGANGDEQRVGVVPEPLAHLPLERLEGDGDLVHQAVGEVIAAGHVRLARLGGDRESRRNGEAEVRHLGEVGALAAEQVLLVLAALLEGVDVLHAHLPTTRSDFASLLRSFGSVAGENDAGLAETVHQPDTRVDEHPRDPEQQRPHAGPATRGAR